ncbi:hypothetical protein U9M48_027919 [Paspalum notatum var. saurae]|uniref:Transposon protein, putative, CACTA, En/Spm sub-class n=1 Tax=Paspalum notatum var. saurae TaxID=547442 RepID=A0AAQ3TVE0_PASNO
MSGQPRANLSSIIFDIMTHLLVHIVKEIGILGPVFLHNMFPFEWYMAVLKKYVRNRSRPEGCIAKGYETEEGKLAGKGTLEKKVMLCSDNVLFDREHFTVLDHSTLMAPYMEDHKIILRSQYSGKSEAWITRRHIENFGVWLRQHLMRNEEIDDHLSWLARRPCSSTTTFKRYEINGNTFYTRSQDQKSTNQNSGVRIDAIDTTGQTDKYYGYIEEIWELDYGPFVPLFRCQWVKLTAGGVMIDPNYGMTAVDLNNTAYTDEPFVLAADVTQVFYVKDMSTKPQKKRTRKNVPSDEEPKRHIVLLGKKKIMGVEDFTDEEDYNQLDDAPPFKVEVDTSILLINEEAPYMRCDHNEGIINK